MIENPYAGAWVQISSKSVILDTPYGKTPVVNPSGKLLTQKHYVSGRHVGENIIGRGYGEYAYNVYFVFIMLASAYDVTLQATWPKI